MTTRDDIEEIGSYFETATGVGVLATADAKGVVDVAVFARPHVLAGGELGFIMPDRLTYRNLASNPHAAYLFVEDDTEAPERTWRGKRLYLVKKGEERDTERVASLRRRTYDDERDGRYLVRFSLEKVLPLVGAGPDAS